MKNTKPLFIAIWVLSSALFVNAGAVRGDKAKETSRIKNGRKRNLFAYPATSAPTISPYFDSTLTVMVTSPNQYDDSNIDMTNSRIRNTPAPTPSLTRLDSERRNDNKSNKGKRTPSPTAFPTASPTFFPTASPTRRNKKSKNNENKIIENTGRSFPTASPSASSSLSHTSSNTVITNDRTEIPFVSTASPTQMPLSETEIDTAENEETAKIPKSAEQVSISIVKEPQPPPTDNPTMLRPESAPEKQSSDDSDASEAYYDMIPFKNFHIQLTAKESWQSEYDPLVQQALERYLENSMSLRDTQIHHVELTVSSPSHGDDEATSNATLFLVKGHLYVDPIDDNISVDSIQEEVWKQQSIALANHLLIQLNFDADAILATARVILVNLEFVDESDPSNTQSANDDDEDAHVSEAGRKALTVIGLIVAFLLAMGIGIWCISPFDGYDDDADENGSYFGKPPRESFSQASTDEIVVDHDEIQSVTSSLTGAPREDDVEDSMMDDHIYLSEFVPEFTKHHDSRLPLHAEEDDQDSFYSNVQPYFYKPSGADISSPSLSSIEPSICSVWKDPERKQQYESLRQFTNHSNRNDDDDDEEERIIRVSTTNPRHTNDESTITSTSMFIKEESTAGGSISLPAAPSRSTNARTTPPLSPPPPTSISLSESLRLRIASHLAEELFHE